MLVPVAVICLPQRVSGGILLWPNRTCWCAGKWDGWAAEGRCDSFIGFATTLKRSAVLTIRSMLLALLTVCARGTVLLEHPDNSIINQHERWQWLARRLRKLGLPVSWWESVATINSNVSLFPLPYSFPRWLSLWCFSEFTTAYAH